jgi:hypothetical protein
MLNRLSRIYNSRPLRSLDPRNLEAEEEFWGFDREVACYGADSGFGCLVDVELCLCSR